VRIATCIATAALLATPAAAADEVPFVVSPDSVTLAMLQAAKVTGEDYVIDLGSGDGRIVILAARRFGARGLGIDLSPASVVTLYLLPEVNMQLRPKLLLLRAGTRVVSHDFDMEDWEPDQTRTVDAPDKPIGLGKTSKVYMWVVPARVDGAWCGTGKAKGKNFSIAQKYQKVRIDVPAEGGTVKAIEAKVNGNAILSRTKVLNLAFDGQKLRTTYAGGAMAPLKGATFTRPKGQSCG